MGEATHPLLDEAYYDCVATAYRFTDDRAQKVMSASRFGLSRLRRATPSGVRIPPRPEGRGLLRRSW